MRSILDCGCVIDDNGRHFCPSCAEPPAPEPISEEKRVSDAYQNGIRDGEAVERARILGLIDSRIQASKDALAEKDEDGELLLCEGFDDGIIDQENAIIECLEFLKTEIISEVPA